MYFVLHCQCSCISRLTRDQTQFFHTQLSYTLSYMVKACPLKFSLSSKTKIEPDFRLFLYGVDMKKHANIFSTADLLLLHDMTRLYVHPTCSCRLAKSHDFEHCESHDFTTYLTLSRVGNWFLAFSKSQTPKKFRSCRVRFQVRYW